jgi:hypothetical protein
MANSAKAVKNAVFTPSATDIAFANTTVLSLDDLLARRKQWEATDYKKANQGLYALLSDCLAVFEDKFLKASASEQKTLRLDLIEKLKVGGAKPMKSSTTLSMFVRYVFGADRKRTHRYAYVLKAAISHGVAAKDLPAYLFDEGGVEEVVKKMVVSEEAKAKRAAVETAKGEVKKALEIASTKPYATVPLAGLKGKYAVLLAEPKPDGMANIVGVLSEANDTLVEALLAQMAKRKISDDETAAALEKEASDLLGASAEAANAPAMAKQA